MFGIIIQHADSLIIAAVGGFFLNMMNLYEDAKRPKADRVPKDAIYWVFFLFWPLAGAVIAYVYIATGTVLQAFPSFLAGLTAPAFLQSLMEKTLIPPALASVEDGNE